MQGNTYKLLTPSEEREIKDHFQSMAGDHEFLLREADGMQKRLLRLNNDQQLQRDFYSILLQKAGKKESIVEIITMLLSSINTYVFRKINLPDLIDAILDDPKVNIQVKGALTKMLEHKLRLF